MVIHDLMTKHSPNDNHPFLREQNICDAHVELDHLPAEIERVNLIQPKNIIEITN